jgi:hypothetical protein
MISAQTLRACRWETRFTLFRIMIQLASTRQTAAPADVAPRLGCHHPISFGEMKARRIFSFAFHIARLIDAILSSGIRSQQIH